MASISLAFLLSWFFAGVAIADSESPHDVVKTAVEDVLARLQSDKAEIEKNPDRIYNLVEEIVLPHVDMDAVSRSVLGKYWRNATDVQRQQFEDEFKVLLMRTYGTALSAYTGQTVNYLPGSVQPSDRTNLVKLEIDQGGGPPIPVAFAMHRKDDRWLLYDFKIDGVSLVQNYRSNFASIIRRGGMESLLDHLQKHNAGQA
ncbi:MAG: ABC transporter substrate-binding protein [Chromatiales bacterium]|nr:ABC transporter substrate-binding protein [Chromatiales bacterium]